MADFVAVIRRAVDGLSDNTPEMRAKVYEKARGAVVRQLESMKPRPPEEMLKRQLDKLESAIIEVESEHALALPELEAAMLADDAPALDAAAETQPADDGAVPVDEAPAAPDLPAEEPPAPYEAPTPYEEPAPYTEPAPYEEPATYTEPAPYEEPAADEAPPQPEPEPQPVAVPLGMTPPEPPRNVAYNRSVWQDDDDYVSYVSDPAPASEPEAQPAPEPEPVVEAPPEDPYAAERATVRAQWSTTPAYEGPAHPYGEAPGTGPEFAEPDAISTGNAERADFMPADPFAAEPYRTEDDFVTPAPVDSYAPAYGDDTAPRVLTPQDGYLDTDADRGYADFAAAPQAEEPAARTDDDARDPWDIPEDSALPDLAAPAPEPAPTATAIPVVTAAAAAAAAPVFTSTSYARPAAPPAPAANWDESPFDDVPLPSSPSLAAAPAPGKTEERDLFQQDWGELDNFAEPAAAASTDPAAFDRIETSDIERPKRVIRFEPKRRVDFTSLGLGLLGLLIVGGAAFGAWTYRETLSELVSGVVGSPPAETAKPANTTTTTTPPATTPATPAGESGAATPAQETPASPEAPATETAAVEPNTPVIDDNTVGDKFTQRLMKDGSEVDAGDGAAGTTEEGKSVAAQNVAAPDLPPPAAASGTETATTPATGTAANVTGATQKMYVYEERIGQTVPTAIEGAVAWSLKNEPGADGKVEPVVEGQIAVPERGMTAKFTLRRNTDASLPASHLIEIVFSLPADFEGGAIDSVQRVAMKQTEQDRGNSLVAVPAKITDDFHMIALNNYPDAMATNLDLLQSRNWIDIPVTYRNGRRALLTMEKGPTGTEAFNTAIREWKRLGPTAAQAN